MILKKQEKKSLNFQSEESNSKKISLKKIKIPKSAQDTIPFDELYENGVIKVNEKLYCIICNFTNINYLTIRDDEQKTKFIQYCDVLNSLDPQIHTQLLLINKSIEEQDLYASLLPKDNPNDDLEEMHDAYKEVQTFFIKRSLDNTSDKENYFALGYLTNKDADNVFNILKKAHKEVQTQFKKLDSTTKILSSEEILELFYGFYHPDALKEDRFLLPKDIYSRGVKMKDFIAPSSFKFKPSYVEMGTSYNRTLYVRDYPQLLKDTFISDLMDNPYNISTSIHIEPTDTGDAMTFLQRKLTALESQSQERKKKNHRAGTDYIPWELKNAIKENEELLESIQKKNKKIFYVGVYINISASSIEQLEDITRTINRICRKHLIICDVLTHQQEIGMASVLPLANNKAGIKRILLTDSTAILMPFSAQSLMHPGGFFYGYNQVTGAMTVFNRKSLKNPNGFVLGIPGSGKSLSEKLEIIDVLELTNDDVIIVDPEREFLPLCEKYNGESIIISAGAKTKLNVMDVSKDYADDDDPIQLKAEFILSICQTIKGSLTASEKTIIDRCVKLSYRKFIENNWNQDYIPDFNDFFEHVKDQPEKEAKDIALAIELYTTGSLNVFSGKSNVSLSNRLTVFDTKDLGKNLKKLGILITLDTIWNRICQNRDEGKFTWIVTDEFYLLFDDTDGEESYSANYYYELYKRARKWGGIPTGITQNIEDLLQSRKARTMLSNSQFLLLFDQAPSDRQEIQKLLNLSDTQMSYVTNAEQGSGLLISGKYVIPLERKYPDNNILYKIITTKVGETGQA